jgi:D-aminopeptidase
MVYRVKILLDQRLDPLYEAVIEATEEAILNALCMARDMDGANGNVCTSLPLADVKALVAGWQEERARQAAAPPPATYRRPGPPDAATQLRLAAPAAKPTAVRGAEGMARPTRPAAPTPRPDRPAKPERPPDAKERTDAAPPAERDSAATPPPRPEGGNR